MRTLLTAGLIVMALGWAPAGLTAAPSAKAMPTTAPAFKAPELLAHPEQNWLTNGGNLFNQRFSPLTEINRSNVATLKAKWRTRLDGSGNGPQFSGQGQPVIYNGMIYITTGASDVFALDATTGQIKWRYAAKLDANRIRVCCGWVNRGVAIGEGKIFHGQLDAQIVALDQHTGKELWRIQAEDPLVGYSIVSAPLYFDGMVITGFGGGELGTRGRMKAYNAKDGKLLWTFYTIPAPGEFGSESWPADNDAWKFGGAPIWQTPAVDPQLGLIYFSTGNAAPDFNGSARKGDNLFTVSIVAIEAKTGKYRWHFQQVKHDIWDYDSPNPVILFDAPYFGTMRKGLAQVSKTGWVYILDRETGKPLLGIEDRPVPQEPRQHTAATQPFVIGDSVVPQEMDYAPEGFELVNKGRIFTPFWDKIIVYKPQMGVNWPPSSYDPATNRMFICGIDHVATSASDQKGFTEPNFQSMYMGGTWTDPGVARRGVITAMNLTTNRIVWQQQWPSSCFNGTLATKGGLMFIGRSDGRFTALNTDTGQRLWQFQTDAGVAASASSFMHNGRQHIAVLSAGTMFGGGKKGDSVWLFSLDGTIDSLTAEQAGTAIASNDPVFPEGKPDLAKGKITYTAFCVSCHGDKGVGGHGGGATLANASRDIKLLARVAWNGRNTMPAFRTLLTTEQLRDVSHYITDELLPAAQQQ